MAPVQCDLPVPGWPTCSQASRLTKAAEVGWGWLRLSVVFCWQFTRAQNITNTLWSGSFANNGYRAAIVFLLRGWFACRLQPGINFFSPVRNYWWDPVSILQHLHAPLCRSFFNFSITPWFLLFSRPVVNLSHCPPPERMRTLSSFQALNLFWFIVMLLCFHARAILSRQWRMPVSCSVAVFSSSALLLLSALFSFNASGSAIDGLHPGLVIIFFMSATVLTTFLLLMPAGCVRCKMPWS